MPTVKRCFAAAAVAVFLALASGPAGATSDAGMDMDGGMHSRPDGRAPAGVMGDHVAMKGAWSLAYPSVRPASDHSPS